MDNNAVFFKPASIEDAAQLSRVAMQAYIGHYTHLWHDGGDWYMQKSFSAEQLAKEMQDPNARFFIVEVNGQPAGFIKLNIDAAFAAEASALELERIYFVPEASGKGIGSKAMKYVFGLAENLGKKIIWLKVMDSSTAAIAFYNRLGFSICGKLRLDYTEMKTELRGMFIMKKYLR